MSKSPSRGTAAACRVVVAALCVALVAAFGAAPAQASSLSLQYEPAYTKGTKNQWYTTQYHSNDDAYYYVCASAGDNGVAIPGEQPNGSNGPGTVNCGGNTSLGTTAPNWALNPTTPPASSGSATRARTPTGSSSPGSSRRARTSSRSRSTAGRRR
jgi:hypothetical protein